MVMVQEMGLVVAGKMQHLAHVAAKRSYYADGQTNQSSPADAALLGHVDATCQRIVADCDKLKAAWDQSVPPRVELPPGAEGAVPYAALRVVGWWGGPRSRPTRARPSSAVAWSRPGRHVKTP